MSDPAPTVARQITVHSSAMAKGSAIWVADLVIGLRDMNTKNDKDPLRTPTLRLLAQETAGTALEYATKWNRKGEPTAWDKVKHHHAPLLFQAATRPAHKLRDKDYVYPSKLSIAASRDAIEAMPEGTSFPYDMVSLSAFDQLEKKPSAQILIPPCALAAGGIHVLLPGPSNKLCKKLSIPSDAKSWKDSQKTISVFGEASGMKVAFAKSDGKNHVPIILVSDGIEIDVVVNSPFQNVDVYELRVRVIFEAARDAFFAWPVGDVATTTDAKYKNYADFLGAFDSVMSRFSAGNRPLALTWSKETCAVAWPLGKADKSFEMTGVTPLDFRPDTLDVVLMSDADPQSALAPATEVAVADASIASFSPVQILTINSSGGIKGDIAVAWDAAGKTSVDFPDGLNVIAEVAEFADRARLRYEAAHLLPFGADPDLYAFFPLERGLLQIPVPKAVPKDEKDKKDVIPDIVSVIQGPVRVAYELNDASKLKPRIEIGAAAQVRIDASLADASSQNPIVTAAFHTARGTVSGLLFAAASSPRDGEMLPDLSAGPIAVEPIDLAFGKDKTALGYAASVAFEKSGSDVTAIKVGLKGWSEASALPKDPKLAKPILAWLAHPEMALVSSFPMTRTRSVPGRPSETRDLVVFEHNAALKTGETIWKKPLTLTTGVGAVVASSFPVLTGLDAITASSGALKWPWPGDGDTGAEKSETSDVAVGVSLASLTLPGVEFRTPSDIQFSSMTGSLRFDLPILGELFATTDLPRPKAPAPKPTDPPEDPPASAFRPELINEFWDRGANRIALSRTMNDRISGWSALDPKKEEDLNVAGLVEPYKWTTKFALLRSHNALPLGAYKLAGYPWAGGAALAGWSGSIEQEKINAEVIGFSVKHREEKVDGKAFGIDTRGISVQKVPEDAPPLEWRLLSYDDSKSVNQSHIAVTAPLLAFSFGDRIWGLRIRDLPCRDGGDGTIEFSAIAGGKLTGLESHLGPRGSVFMREALPLSNYEWSLFVEEGRAYTLPLGPFRFRPLRLAALTISGLDATARLTKLTVIGNVEPPGKPAAHLMPFVDDDPYASGNPVALSFTIDADKATLDKIGTVTIAGEEIAVDVKTNPEVVFRADADLLYRGKKAARASDKAAPFVLRLTLAPAASGKNEVNLAGTIAASLFGVDFGTSPAPDLKIALQALGETFVLEAMPSKAIAPPVSMTKATLTWTAEDDPALDLEGALALSHSSVNGPILRWDIGGSLNWLGMTSSLANFTANHRRGVLTLTCRDDAPGGEFLTGFPQPKKPYLTLSLAIAKPKKDLIGFLEARLSEKPEDKTKTGPQAPEDKTAPWPPVDIRHSLHSQPQQADWQSRLMISLPTTDLRSAIHWPLSSLPDLSAVKSFAPDPLSPDGWMQDLQIGPSDGGFEHLVRPIIVDAPLDLSLIGYLNNKYVLTKPWHFRAGTRHEFSLPKKPMSTSPAAAQDWTLDLAWTGIDEVVICDAALLVAEANAVISKVKVKEEDFAFAARYQQTVLLGAEYVPTAGVLNRALARAGLPTFEMLAGIAAPASKPPTGLLIFGASIVEIARERDAIRTGYTAVTPWFSAFAKGDAGVLANIAQAGKKASTLLVSTFDLAARLPHRLPDATPHLISARDGSVGALARAIDGFTRDGYEGHSAPFMPVSQAISQGYEDREDSAIWKKRPEQDWKERPIWLRSLLVWREVLDWRQHDKTGVFHERVTVLLADASTAKPDEIRVLRIASAPDDGKSDISRVASTYNALVLAESDVKRIALNGSEIAWAKSADAEQRRKVTRLSLAIAEAPLAVAVGEITDDPQYDGWPTHDVAAFLDLPAELDEPRRGSHLRQRSRAVFGSPAVAWPRASERLGNDVRAAPALGSQQPLQDARHAWAGEARNLALPARTFTDQTLTKASVLAIGQRALFRRPEKESGVGPPDRALMPIPPRARVPLPAAVQKALAGVQLKDAEGAIAPIQPSAFEIVTTGRRPGVLFFHYDGLLFADGENQAFDKVATRFGRPADRGPVVWRQIRSPRSTVFPDETSLDRRRQTFIEEFEPLRKLVLTGGPLAVLRFYPQTGPLRALLFRPGDDQGPFANFALSPEWIDGVLKLVVSGLDGFEPTFEILAKLGILQGGPEGLRATLSIGRENFLFEELSYDKYSKTIVLSLALPDEGLAARAALTAATPDTRASLVLECGHGTDKAASSPIKLHPDPRTALQAGPLRIISIDLPLVPMNRPSLPVQRATLAFGDPAYDRELASKTHAARLQDAKGPIVLALDRIEYDPLATLHFAFGRIDTAQSSDVTWKAADQPAAGTITFALIRESAPDTVEPLALASVKATTTKKDEISGLTYQVYPIEAAEAYAVALADFRRMDPVTFAPLAQSPDVQPGDRLQLAVAWDTFSLAIEVTITAEPVIAPPAAVYGLATVDGSAPKRLTAALFASAPLPQVVEYPDLLGDLAKGLVRRRGLFVWPFMPRSNLTTHPFAALIKIDRTGGGQLPESLTDFAAPEP